MLRIIEGQPGSGKTYYAVQYLSKYAEFDKLYNTYILQSDVLLITNIDDIKVKHVTVDEFLKYQLYKIDKYKEYMSKNNYKRSIIIVDEAQRYFSTDALKQYKDEVNDIYFFFEYHRHLGVDIFLIVQTVSALPKRIVNLSEYVIRARQGSVSLPKVFIYDALDVVTGERLFITKLTKSTDVFRLYKSFEFEESVKRGSVLLRKWVLGLSLFAVPLIIAVFLLSSGFLFGARQGGKQVPATSSNTSTQTKTSSNTSTQTKTSSNTSTQTKTSSNTSTQTNDALTPEQFSQLVLETEKQKIELEKVLIKQRDICIFGGCQKYFLREKFVEFPDDRVAGIVEISGRRFFYVQPREQFQEQQTQEQQTQEQQTQEQQTQEQQKKEVKYKTPFSHWK